MIHPTIEARQNTFAFFVDGTASFYIIGTSAITHGMDDLVAQIALNPSRPTYPLKPATA